MRVDYHFHPNFPSFACPALPWSRARARRIWRAFERHRLDAVIVAEHAYKRPRSSYELLLSVRPQSARTEIFPGVEVLTSEGVDLVVFAQDAGDVYARREFLIPWKLSCEEVIRTVETDARLFGVVTHPCTPGLTGMVHLLGGAYTEQAIQRLKFLERHNATTLPLQRLLKATGLRHVVPGRYSRMRATRDCPLPLPDGAIATGGSDAHHPWSLGDCMVLDGVAPVSRAELFHAITTRTGIFEEGAHRPLLALPVEAGTVLREWIMKKTGWYASDA